GPVVADHAAGTDRGLHQPRPRRGQARLRRHDDDAQDRRGSDRGGGPRLMRTFVLRARAAPTDSRKLLATIGQEAHPEILAHTLMNAIFVAQSHRPDVVVHLVLESTQDYSRAIRFEANAMHDIGGFDERALLGKIAKALDVSAGMGKEQERPVE